MRRFLVTINIFAVVVLSSTAVSAQMHGIVPGDGIGAYRIGQDADPIITGLGTLYEETDETPPPYHGYFWPLKRIGILVDIDTKKVAAVALVLDDTLQTNNGITVGSTTEEVRLAYGKEERLDSGDDNDTLVYDSRGVAFVVDKGGALENRVSKVYVFRPGEYQHLFPPDEDQ